MTESADLQVGWGAEEIPTKNLYRFCWGSLSLDTNLPYNDAMRLDHPPRDRLDLPSH